MAKKLDINIKMNTEKKDISPSRMGVEVTVLWQRYCPELRFMQFICNFQSWAKQDCFYLSNEKTLEKMKEYCEQIFRS